MVWSRGLRIGNGVASHAMAGFACYNLGDLGAHAIYTTLVYHFVGASLTVTDSKLELSKAHTPRAASASGSPHHKIHVYKLCVYRFEVTCIIASIIRVYIML
jgi:hypothetical protein